MRKIRWELNKPHWYTALIYYVILTIIYFLFIWNFTSTSD
jgi:hypothetical protein